MADQKKIETETVAAFDELNRRLAEASPGVIELLRVYGGYEEAIERSNYYLGVLSPAPRFSVSNSTNS